MPPGAHSGWLGRRGRFSPSVRADLVPVAPLMMLAILRPRDRISRGDCGRPRRARHGAVPLSVFDELPALSSQNRHHAPIGKQCQVRTYVVVQLARASRLGAPPVSRRVPFLARNRRLCRHRRSGQVGRGRQLIPRTIQGAPEAGTLTSERTSSVGNGRFTPICRRAGPGRQLADDCPPWN